MIMITLGYESAEEAASDHSILTDRVWCTLDLKGLGSH